MHIIKDISATFYFSLNYQLNTCIYMCSAYHKIYQNVTLIKLNGFEMVHHAYISSRTELKHCGEYA